MLFASQKHPLSVYIRHYTIKVLYFAVKMKFWRLFSVFLWFGSKKGVSRVCFLYSRTGSNADASSPSELDDVSSASSVRRFTVVTNHCWRIWGVTHCWRWLLERELWCFWGWTSRPAGGWRSCLQHRRRRWFSPWERGNIPENIALAVRTEQKMGEDEAGTFKHRRSRSPVASVEMASQSGPGNHTDPKT